MLSRRVLLLVENWPAECVSTIRHESTGREKAELFLQQKGVLVVLSHRGGVEIEFTNGTELEDYEPGKLANVFDFLFEREGDF